MKRPGSYSALSTQHFAIQYVIASGTEWNVRKASLRVAITSDAITLLRDRCDRNDK
ncbi:hypothetical protein [Nostoc sp. DedQUE09]|uniref:hypothetical protein n=1 Tax=Nostoc sp. DedQUE09 TaxID=3075394 RepID=UPI002AD5151B|nr:hypothetical protein [Nostoc sp. DedQUE09]MDZ7955161.1 hypothetical protein [Nostoc sp. DedQUE09]